MTQKNYLSDTITTRVDHLGIKRIKRLLKNPEKLSDVFWLESNMMPFLEALSHGDQAEKELLTQLLCSEIKSGDYIETLAKKIMRGAEEKENAWKLIQTLEGDQIARLFAKDGIVSHLCYTDKWNISHEQGHPHEVWLLIQSFDKEQRFKALTTSEAVYELCESGYRDAIVSSLKTEFTAPEEQAEIIAQYCAFSGLIPGILHHENKGKDQSIHYDPSQRDEIFELMDNFSPEQLLRATEPVRSLLYECDNSTIQKFQDYIKIIEQAGLKTTPRSEYSMGGGF